MHNNYHLLQPLSLQLSRKFRGGLIVACFSQHKDELIIALVKNQHTHYLRVILQRELTTLHFPKELHRARRNTVDLFPEILQKSVKEVFCFKNERCLALVLSDSWMLLLKMFEGKANAILCHDDRPLDIFKKKFAEDLSIIPSQMHRNYPHGKERFIQLDGDLQNFMPTLGSKVKRYLQKRGYDEISLQEKWDLLQEMLAVLQDPQYFLQYQDHLPVLLLFRDESFFFSTRDPVEALNEFYKAYITRKTLLREKKAILQGLKSRIKRTKAYILRLQQRRASIENQIPLQVIGDMIMAYMHQIPRRARSVELPHFETNEPITIKLKPQQSPQKNAEYYYRKSKNQKKEINVLQKNIQLKTRELQETENHRTFIEDCFSLKDLRNYSKKHHFLKAERSATTRELFKTFQFEGYTILVGKSAQSNDLLTQRHAHKEDLWLHAKDVKGSHVIIKQQPGKPFPKTVIERAAQLAAYYSKRKHDSLCPVAFTEKKYVRKPKGASPGEVVIEKERVILVSPSPSL